MTFNRSWYGAGTASVANASTAVTGAGTNWLTGGIREGDFFLAGGDMVPIASVNSNTSITLTDGWPGASRTGASYKIVPATDGVRIVLAARDVLDQLTNGNISSIASLAGLADRLPYFTGPGATALTTFTAAARALLALTGANGKIPVFTGASAAALRDIVGTVSQAGGVPTGAIVEQGSNANGNYVRFADGTQICWRNATHSFNTDGYQLFNFAASFAAIPIGMGSIANTDGSSMELWNTRRGSVQASSTTQWSSRAPAGTGNANTGTLYMIAIGRWF